MLPEINKLLQPRPRKYRNLVKHLSNHLMTTDENNLNYSETDVFSDLTSNRGTNRFLGVYSARGIEFALKKFGVIDALEKKGLPNYKVIVNTDDPYKHRIRIIHDIRGKTYLSHETVMRRGSFTLSDKFTDNRTSFNFIIVEWFLLQHPLKQFSRTRPQLPGQDYPGLGLSELAFEIFYWTARRLKSDGIIVIPNFLHSALFYGRQFLFLDSIKQGQLYALSKLVSHKVRIDQLSWACTEGQLIIPSQATAYLWEPSPMALPVSKRLKDHFHSSTYVQTVLKERNNFRAAVNRGYKKQYNSSWQAI